MIFHWRPYIFGEQLECYWICVQILIKQEQHGVGVNKTSGQRDPELFILWSIGSILLNILWEILAKK